MWIFFTHSKITMDFRHTIFLAIYTHIVRGFVKLEKKIRGQTPPTHPPTQFFFETCKAKQQYKKTLNFSKKQIQVGASPTHPLPSFSRIFGFFLTWQNPLACLVDHAMNNHPWGTGKVAFHDRQLFIGGLFVYEMTLWEMDKWLAAHNSGCS